MKKPTIYYLLAGAGLFALLLVAGFFAFVWTAPGQALDNRAYFGHEAIERAALAYDEDLLRVVSVRALFGVAAVLFLISLVRRRVLTGLVVIAALACAVEGAELFKKHLPRQELAADYGPVPAYFIGDTYPSGHTTIGTSVALAFLLLLPARWRPWLAAAAGWISASYATAVLFVGWHRPSDALGGILWSGLCMALAAAAVLAVRQRNVRPGPACRPALALSALLGIAGCTLAWLATGWTGQRFLDADMPFLVMTLLIVAAATALTAWFGRLLASAEHL